MYFLRPSVLNVYQEGILTALHDIGYRCVCVMRLDNCICIGWNCDAFVRHWSCIFKL